MRTEKRVMKMFDQREMTFEVSYDGSGLCKVKFAGGGPRRDWGRDRDEGWDPREGQRERDRDEGWDPREGQQREPRPPMHHGPPPARTSAPGDLELNPALAADNYDLIDGGKATIAARAAASVVLEPRSRDRGAIRIWADVEKRIPLRMDARMHGATEWKTIFEVQSVAFGPVEKLTGGKAPEKAEPLVVPQWLPAGFEHVSTTKMSWGGWGRSKEGEARVPEPIYESQYSDGVTSIRVVVSTKERWWKKLDKPAPPGAVPVARHKMGPFAEYGLKVDDLYVTVVGTLSEETMQRVVGSLTRAAAAGK
jgi:negative regulator of sigma E activity